VSKRWKRVGWVFGGAALVALAVLIPFLLITPAVSGDTADERISKAVELADRASAGAADALALAASSDADPKVRATALLCLNRFQRPEDRPVVEAALTDTDARVRSAACKTAVASHDDPTTVEQLTEVCRSDADPAVVRAAMYALAASKEATALVALVQMLEHDSDAKHQTLAAQALVRKFGMPVEVNRRDPNLWRRLVASIKYIDAVQDAFRTSGVDLVQDVEALQQSFEEHASKCHSRDAPLSDTAGPAAIIRSNQP